MSLCLAAHLALLSVSAAQGSPNDVPAVSPSETVATPESKSLARFADRYRQFDFWIGDWDVYSNAGKKVGENKIENSLNGYLLMENWTSNGGGQGRSMNFFDRHIGKWHQIWVDDGGGVIDCAGSIKAGAMHLIGTHAYAEDGRIEQYRMSFTPNAKGEVIQHIEQSKDDGKTWYVWFHGRYVRRHEPITYQDKKKKLNEKTSRRRFDFWIGDWDALNPAGKKTGRNHIQSLLAGCLILEHWSGGSEGNSFNFFDPGLKKWRQHWVSDGGGLVWYEGGFADTAMQMAGTNLKPNGAAVAASVTWTPLSGNKVHHVIRHRVKSGPTRTYFDGTYTSRD